MAVGLLLFAGTYAGYRYGYVSAAMDANLKYTEQIDFLLNSIEIRERSGDAPASILKDLKAFSEMYYCSYEGQPFVVLMEKFIRRRVMTNELFYSAHEGF
jgi:hypothetical protein